MADRLTAKDIVEAVVLTDRTMRNAGFERPRIGVAALNPHAGEGGELGTEEIDVKGPAPFGQTEALLRPLRVDHASIAISNERTRAS